MKVAIEAKGPEKVSELHAAVLRSLGPVAEGLSRTFGADCEVVIHDFADPERSIVAISGNVTNRKVGGSVSQIGLDLVAQGDAAQDQIGYVTRTRDGKVLKSSTVLLRDADGHVFGALCINLDVTELRAMGRRLHQLAGPAMAMPVDVEFSDDIGQVLISVIGQEEAALGRPFDRSRKEDRLQIVAALKRRGVFAVQRAVPVVAEELNVSRATLYSYLEEIRSRQKAGSGAAPAPGQDTGNGGHQDDRLASAVRREAKS